MVLPHYPRIAEVTQMFEMFGIEPEMAEKGLNALESNRLYAIGRFFEPTDPHIALDYYQRAHIYSKNIAALRRMLKVGKKIKDKYMTKWALWRLEEATMGV